MKSLARSKKIAFALGALAAVLFVSAPGHAEGVRSHGFEGGHGGGAVGHPGFEGHHFEGHHFEGHQFEDHHFEGHHFEGHHFEGRGRFGFAPVFPYPYVAPYYGPEYAPDYPDPSYWYYCSSSQAYYPSVTSCPEAWVPVPAQ